MTTTTEPGTGQILKQDELGRVRTPRAQREAILDQFEASGMSGVAFAAHVGVKYPTFAGWVQRRQRERSRLPEGEPGVSARAAAPGCQWIELVAGNPQSGTAGGVLSIHLPGGARLEVRDADGAALAARLLANLMPREARGC